MIAFGTPSVISLVPLSAPTVVPLPSDVGLTSFSALFCTAVSNSRPTVPRIRLTSFSKSCTLLLSRAISSSILLFPSEFIPEFKPDPTNLTGRLSQPPYVGAF
jgi:hypothetical protein